MRARYVLGLTFVAVLVLGLVAVGCGKKTADNGAPTPGPASSASGAKAPPSTGQAKVQYTCPMHPEIVRDQPGKCPMCGMDLVEKKEVKTSAATEGERNWYCPKHPDKRYAKGEKCEICGGELVELKPGESSPTAAAASNLPVGNKKDAQGRYICPVSGDVVENLSTAEHTEYQGRVYYFCCGDCPPKFKADPDKYLKGTGKPEGSGEMKGMH